MKSMTGFATAATVHKTTGKKIEIKIKSVNNRFLEFRMHTIPELMEYESEIRKHVQALVHRGSVDLFIYYKKDQGTEVASDMQINVKLAEDFLKQTLKVAKKLKIDSDLGLADVLKLSGAVQSKSKDTRWDKKTLLNSVSEVLSNFDLERQREGKALKKEIQDLLSQLEAVRLTLENLAQNLPNDIQKRLQDKIKSFKEDVDPQRIQQEILFFIDKSDIKEELVRLKEHIRACKELLNSAGPEGKKLDFYTQELFREMNTVGSKSSSVKITAEVLQGKAIIEKIRQQVQNIE